MTLHNPGLDLFKSALILDHFSQIVSSAAYLSMTPQEIEENTKQIFAELQSLMAHVDWNEAFTQARTTSSGRIPFKAYEDSIPLPKFPHA